MAIARGSENESAKFSGQINLVFSPTLVVLAADRRAQRGEERRGFGIRGGESEGPFQNKRSGSGP